MTHDYEAFTGDTNLAGLILLREHAIIDFEERGVEDGFRAMALVADLALARVERLERLVRAQRASRRVEREFSRSLSVQEREAQALLRPHTGNVDNVHPIRRPTGGGGMTPLLGVGAGVVFCVGLSVANGVLYLNHPQGRELNLIAWVWCGLMAVSVLYNFMRIAAINREMTGKWWSDKW